MVEAMDGQGTTAEENAKAVSALRTALQAQYRNDRAAKARRDY